MGRIRKQIYITNGAALVTCQPAPSEHHSPNAFTLFVPFLQGGVGAHLKLYSAETHLR